MANPQENPFTGFGFGPRNNALSERDSLMKNDRMLDPRLRFSSDMSDDERNAISRDYYLSLADAQGMSAPAAAEAKEAAGSSSSSLPFGWAQRTAGLDTSQLVRRPNEGKSPDAESSQQPAQASSAAAACAAASTQPNFALQAQGLLAATAAQMADCESDCRRLRTAIADLKARLPAGSFSHDPEYASLDRDLGFSLAKYEKLQEKELTLLKMIASAST